MKSDDFVDVTSLTAAQALAAHPRGADQRRGAGQRLPGAHPSRRAARAGLGVPRREHALEQARDVGPRAPRRPRRLGPLHGLPVGVKDIIDTADMPTEDGTVLHAGRRPAYDATWSSSGCARPARSSSARPSRTELATYAPGKTRNPHNPEHTPGGSSSGSAAAVAAHMVPVALGTQTNGSVIRPAAYCGVYGYKPTLRAGVAPRHPRAVAAARPGGLHRAHGRGPGDHRRAADRATTSTTPTRGRSRGRRLREVALQEPPLPPRVRVHEDAELGRRRGADARGLRRAGGRRSASRRCRSSVPAMLPRRLAVARHDHGSRPRAQLPRRCTSAAAIA